MKLYGLTYVGFTKLAIEYAELDKKCIKLDEEKVRTSLRKKEIMQVLNDAQIIQMDEELLIENNRELFTHTQYFDENV